MDPTSRMFFAGSASGPAGPEYDIKINYTLGTTVATGSSSASAWFSNANLGNFGPGGLPPQKLNSASDFTVVGNGILRFTVDAGSYTFYGRSGNGSESTANSAGSGFAATGTMTFSSQTDLMLLVPCHGSGSYGGGGGLFLCVGTNYTSPSAVVLVMGGGGGGYSLTYQSYALPGAFTSNAGVASTRRGLTGQNYDGGAGLFNTYTPETYQNAPGRALHFVQGGRGGTHANCGSNDGGFGGGGGACPAGAGGYVGGYPGGDPGGVCPGGGGTSYYNTTYISSAPTITQAASHGTAYYSKTAATANAIGYFGLYKP